MTALTERTPHRVPRAAWAQMIRTEGLIVWRDPAGVLLPLGLPLLILLMNSLGIDRDPVPAFNDMSALSAYVTPLTLLMILAMVGMINLPSHLATYRATRVLRRLAVTPAHPAMVLAAQVAVNLALATIGVAVGLVVAFTMLGVDLPQRPLAALGALALAAVAMYAIGVLIAAIAPSANAAIAIGLVAFFGVMALGGGFAPRETLPDVVAAIGERLPFGAAHELLVAAWIGASPGLDHVVALAATAVLAAVLAARLFRWE